VLTAEGLGDARPPDERSSAGASCRRVGLPRPADDLGELPPPRLRPDFPPPLPRPEGLPLAGDPVPGEGGTGDPGPAPPRPSMPRKNSIRSWCWAIRGGEREEKEKKKKKKKKKRDFARILLY
jgi:hypothetical protein